MSKKLKQLSRKVDLSSPLRIPEQKSGKFRIIHTIEKKGAELEVISMRNALLMGFRPTKVKLEHDSMIHKLVNKNNSVMMSDSPQEIFLHLDGINMAHGKVLIAGLGLGLVAHKIAEKAEVKEVIVVEKEKDIIKMVNPYLPKKVNVVHDDIFNYLKKNKSDFDYAFFDIWYVTSEWIFLEFILPLRRLVWKYHGKKYIKCWAEEEIVTQLRKSLAGITRLPIDNLPDNPLYHAFRKGISEDERKTLETNYENVIYSILNYGKREVTLKIVDKFLHDIGSPDWEKRWNWDKIVNELKAKINNKKRRA